MHAETVLESEIHRVPELPEQRAGYESYASSLPEGKLEAIITALRHVHKPVLLACSGGGDSVFLGECLRLAEVPFAVAHVNHHLRASAHCDEQFVRKLTRWWGVGGHFIHLFPSNDGEGIEASAREVRYRALLHKCLSEDRALMTGHTASDQLETLFMRLGRGTGLRGLPGIQARLTVEGVAILRPILDVWRAEIRHALSAAGTPWVDDPSNASGFALRNRIRHGAVEAFQREFSEPATGRSLRLLAEESQLYKAMIREKAASLPIIIEDGRALMKADTLARLEMSPAANATREDHDALTRSVLAEVLTRAEIPFTERLLIEVAEAMSLRESFTLTARGVRIECSAGTVDARRVEAPSAPFSSLKTRETVSTEVTRLHDIADRGPCAIGSFSVEVRRMNAQDYAKRQELRDDDAHIEYFDCKAIDENSVFRSLTRTDMWIAPGEKRRNLWARAKRDGLKEDARRSAVVLANDTDVYWLLGGRRSAIAWITDATRSIFEVRIRHHHPGVETP